MSKRLGGWIPLIPLLCLIGLLWLLASSLWLNPQELPSPLINRPLSKTVFLNKAFKPVPAVIHFFSNEDEKATIEKIIQKWPIPFYGVRYKMQGNKAVASKQASPYEWVISDGGNIGIELGVANIPEFYILDGGHIIRYKHTGPLSEALFESTFLPILSQLQASPLPSPSPSHFTFKVSKSTDVLTIYEKLIKELRCVTCQNQTLADSSAPVAVSMRAFIYSKLHEGATEAEIKTFLVQRYGDYVLYNPPLKKETWLLWIGPFVLLAVGLSLAIGLMMPRKKIRR